MSMLIPRSRTCRMCGEEVKDYMFSGAYVHEASDLDMRPGESLRSSVEYVQRCPQCGYVASDIERYETTATPEWIASEEYLGLDGVIPEEHADDDDTILQLYRFYKLARHDGNVEDAAYSLLYIAWLYDDEGNQAKATEFRKMSVPLFEETIRKCPDDTELQIVLLDVERRAGMFDQVQEDYHEGMFGIGLLDEDPSDRIVALQLGLAREGDDGHHTMEEVPPSFVSQATPVVESVIFIVAMIALMVVINMSSKRIAERTRKAWQEAEEQGTDTEQPAQGQE